MRSPRVAKVTISLPTGLLAVADGLAKARAKTRSGVIAELLEKEERVRVEALMEQGYREMAEEDRRLAEEAFPLAGEMLRKSTRWGRRGNG